MTGREWNLIREAVARRKSGVAWYVIVLAAALCILLWPAAGHASLWVVVGLLLASGLRFAWRLCKEKSDAP